MQIYYDILEVPLDCNHSDIKSSFRKLSKRYHPDINPDGASRFLEIKQAYDWLLVNHGKVVVQKDEPAKNTKEPPKSPQPTGKDNWWDNFATAEDRSTLSEYRKVINKTVNDLRYDRKTNSHQITLRSSEVRENGIIRVAFDNGFCHNIAFKANVADGATARIGPALYVLKILNDADWTTGKMFQSSWVD